MRYSEHLRVAAIAVAVVILQLVWYAEFPGWRAVDFYVVFMLLLAAGRGPIYGGIYAILGGAVLDSFSAQYAAFHMFYYLVPMAVGTLFRSRMLLQYRQFGALAITLLLLAKIGGQLLVASAQHWISSPVYLFKLSYLPLLFEVALIYLLWPRLSELIPEMQEGRVVA